eukprot:3537645-Amphidinium_carterae.1
MPKAAATQAKERCDAVCVCNFLVYVCSTSKTFELGLLVCHIGRHPDIIGGIGRLRELDGAGGGRTGDGAC